MKSMWLQSAVLFAAVTSMAAAAARAQDFQRMANGKPDFSGIYSQPSTVNPTGPRSDLIFNADKMAPVQPGAESLLYEPRNGDVRHDEPRAARTIPTDGRAHRKGIEPSYYGDSTGKWEGDVLVIDTVNFKRWILDDYHYTDPSKTRWHSDALHTIERLQRKGNKLLYQITIDDPKIFTRPFSQDFEMTLRPDWDELGLLEYVCEENNRCAGGRCASSDVQSDGR